MKRGRKRINVVGQRFGKLVIIEEIAHKNGNKTVRCKCDCGGEVIITYGNLKRSPMPYCHSCRQKFNEYEIEGDIVKIKLTNGVAIVDLEDWDKVKDFYWRGTSKSVRSVSNGTVIYMSRMILGNLSTDEYVFHKDGNFYNNRKSNLAIVRQERKPPFRSSQYFDNK